MGDHCGLATAREEYALGEHEAELLELPQEESKFQKQQVKDLAYKIHGGPVGLANALKKYREQNSQNTTPNTKYGPNALEADLSLTSPSFSAAGAVSNIISTPLCRGEGVSDPKTRLWHKYFTSSTAPCLSCRASMYLNNPASFEIQQILPYNDAVGEEDWNSVLLCSKDESDGWGCAEKIERENLHVIDYVLQHHPTSLYELLVRQQLLYGTLFNMPVTTTSTLRFAYSVYGVGTSPMNSNCDYTKLWIKLGIGFQSDILALHDAMMRVSNSDLLLLTHLKQKDSLPSSVVPSAPVTPFQSTKTPALTTTARKRLVCSAKKKVEDRQGTPSLSCFEETPSSRSPKRKMSSSNSPRPKRRSMGRTDLTSRLFSDGNEGDPFCDI